MILGQFRTTQNKNFRKSKKSHRENNYIEIGSYSFQNTYLEVTNPARHKNLTGQNFFSSIFVLKCSKVF